MGNCMSSLKTQKWSLKIIRDEKTWSITSLEIQHREKSLSITNKLSVKIISNSDYRH